ncbi:MAG TPA: RidA family protein [Sphingomicrobium sp.]|nr:RidA family protein [Sphingomicrobium sp.]
MKFCLGSAAGPLLAVTCAMAQASPLDRPVVERLGKPMLGSQRLPFSDAVRVGDTLYLSGAVGLKPDGTLPAGIDAQARQTMDNIGVVLKGQSLGWGDVVKCTVMLDNIADWPAFNRVYVTYFPDGQFPARSAFGADGLALGALLEVECLAYAGKR